MSFFSSALQMFLVFSHASVSNSVIARKLERERKKKTNKQWKGEGEGEGRSGNAGPQTPLVDISRFGSFVN